MAAGPDIVELLVEDVVYRGKGLARLEGLVVFVPGVLPGERVQATVRERRRSYANAALVRVIEPSPHRMEPACPLAPRAAEGSPPCRTACPGCVYQHAAYAEEVRLKQRQLVEFVRHRVPGFDPAVVADAVASPSDLGYRNKITLHSGLTGSTPALGYIAEDNRTIADVPRCPLAVEPINALLHAVRGQFLAAGPLTRRDLTFRYTSADGALCLEQPVAPLPEHLTESTSLGPLLVPPRSFFQVNAPVVERLISHVVEQVGLLAGSALADLYCGVGVFALAAARAGVPRVLGIDTDLAAIRAAMLNAEALGVAGRAHFAAQGASDGLAEARRLAPPRELTLIVDPPRTGLAPHVAERLMRLRPAGLVYVSCAPDTLARDLGSLVRADYRLRSLRLFDLFPRTACFESVAVLQADGSDFLLPAPTLQTTLAPPWPTMPPRCSTPIAGSCSTRMARRFTACQWTSGSGARTARPTAAAAAPSARLTGGALRTPARLAP